MNLQSIILTNCIGFTLLMILLVSSHLVRQRRQLSDNLFTAMIVATAASCIVEMLTFIFDGNTELKGMHTLKIIGSSYLYLANIFDSYIWCIYVDLRLYHDEMRTRKRAPFIGVPAILAAIAVLFNVSFPFLFRIDENNVHHRELGGNIYFILTLCYIFYSLVILKQYNKNFGKNRFFPIYMFITPILLGATAQFFVYGISVAWCCTALGLVGIYMSLQNELSYIDPLTKLYNRNYLDQILHHISRKKNPAGGIMIDLDYFKSINDQFGHTVGDEALIDAAKIIRQSVPTKALAIRFAGDEFIILMRTNKEQDLIQIEDTLREALKKFNSTEQKLYQLSFSIGHSIYQADATIDSFLNQMDYQMYEEKKLKHSRSSFKITESPA
ncbi:MAG: GGDEF domain-containing protein [Oscillospiraceae bacterium]|nr:GGDEF domain-containing protein [Oscillospiraceae bacterium]